MKEDMPQSEGFPDSPLSSDVNAVWRFALGNIGLCLSVAIPCGAFCYYEIDGNSADDIFAVFIGFGIPCIGFMWIGISAGLIHLRKRFQLSPIPAGLHVVVVFSLIGSMFWSNPIMRWWSVILIGSFISITVAIRTLLQYQKEKYSAC